MVIPSVGSVVLIPFPFSDLSQAKLRPAVVIADVGRDDWILCQITSKDYGDPDALGLTNAEFQHGSLKIDSFARPGKLFTANSALFKGEVGVLKPDAIRRIVDRLTAMLTRGLPT